MKESTFGPEGATHLVVDAIPVSRIEFKPSMTIEHPLGFMTLKTVLGDEVKSVEGPLTAKQTQEHDSLIAKHEEEKRAHQEWMQRKWQHERNRGESETVAQARRVYGSGWMSNFNLVNSATL